MIKFIRNSKLEIIKDDITKQDTDAIVNAANQYLSPGGGVSGAIHRAAGAGLAEECRKLGGCKTGEAKITKGYNLKAKYVIHTVGPVYSGSDMDKINLAKCYKNSLLIAKQNKLKSISFPSISTGIFGYPVEEAAEIALKTIYDFLKENSEIQLVRMVLYSQKDYEIYETTATKVIKT
jgi:O-acetyl-ADP-ribose deacetylase (regulator of RNase III)